MSPTEVSFRLKPDNSNSHEFELHRPSNKGTKLLLKVIKAIIIINTLQVDRLARIPGLTQEDTFLPPGPPHFRGARTVVLTIK